MFFSFYQVYAGYGCGTRHPYTRMVTNLTVLLLAFVQYRIDTLNQKCIIPSSRNILGNVMFNALCPTSLFKTTGFLQYLNTSNKFASTLGKRFWDKFHKEI